MSKNQCYYCDQLRCDQILLLPLWLGLLACRSCYIVLSGSWLPAVPPAFRWSYRRSASFWHVVSGDSCGSCIFHPWYVIVPKPSPLSATPYDVFNFANPSDLRVSYSISEGFLEIFLRVFIWLVRRRRSDWLKKLIIIQTRFVWTSIIDIPCSAPSRQSWRIWTWCGRRSLKPRKIERGGGLLLPPYAPEWGLKGDCVCV
jgi:hypothetical protein